MRGAYGPLLPEQGVLFSSPGNRTLLLNSHGPVPYHPFNTPATLSPTQVGDAHNWRVFIASTMQYTKSALTFDEQLHLIRQRGLTVSDPSRAALWLRKISYFRLSANFLPFKDGEQFRPGVDFNDVAGLYIFDRKLRLLVMDAIERAEVAIRTAVTHEVAHAYGPFGHTSPTNFAPTYDHARFMTELATEEQRTREAFVEHFRQKYRSEPHLPAWMATELLSFGTVSKLYRALAPGLKGNIAAPFGVQDKILGSWLHALSHVRNICAHHGRLWNRGFGVRPTLLSRSLTWPHVIPNSGRVYCTLVILRHMLRIVAPKCNWRTRLFELFDAHPAVSLDAMGIPGDWRTRS